MEPASDKQKSYFFVLCQDLGYAADEAKERAKKKFKLESFTEITKTQLSELIDLLLKKIAEQNNELSKFDPKIIEAGHEMNVCVACGSECIVTFVTDPPVCSRINCVRRYYGGLIK